MCSILKPEIHKDLQLLTTKVFCFTIEIFPLAYLSENLLYKCNKKSVKCVLYFSKFDSTCTASL